jgi:L-rhamnose-H+ transport protein
MFIGLTILIFAGISQGLFILPLAFTRNWKWEHDWLMFSFLGMIPLNWCIAFLLFPQLTSVYRQVPVKELLLLFSFGLLWGVGAVLFGIGMERLGMSLGYPVIMGLIAATGALLPMILTKPETIFTGKGAGVIAGCVLVIVGILLCSKADAARNRQPDRSAKPVLVSGLVIAVLAGLLSALPNMGMNLAVHTKEQAIASGISPSMAVNLVWLLFFSMAC